jgi:hypothetical protein
MNFERAHSAALAAAIAVATEHEGFSPADEARMDAELQGVGRAKTGRAKKGRRPGWKQTTHVLDTQALGARNILGTFSG